MANQRQNDRIRKWTPVFLVLASVLLLLSMQLLLGKDPFKPSTYNSYTRQAMQWRKGEIALDENVVHLELAVYRGRYYVSFPPVPTVPVYLLTFIFGENVPDALLNMLYGVASCLLIFVILKRRTRAPALSAVWAFLICFASSMLPILTDGAVWYQAQMLAFLLTVGAMERMQKGAVTTALILFALSVGCRPFNVLLGPLLVLYGVREHMQGSSIREITRLLLPGVLFGMSIAAAYMWYNYIRFDDVLEFGHNYLPEFNRDGHTQFAVWHIVEHIPIFVFGLPFQTVDGALVFKKFGFSFLLASPVFICYLLWTARDVIRWRFTWPVAVTFSIFILHVLLLLSHRTGGGFQYGARYFVDCIPYVIFYLVLRKGDEGSPAHLGLTRVPWAEYSLLVFGLVHNIVGTYFINI
ncbi:MAG TPA: hypothetical protein PKU80_04500 [Candidatus Limiplasma sp.]|nr:hypothetical protein [Candidatus Limiplasma sp.]HRX07708.1 hypothetical protein [Candidatus Limiplasma sp.]